MHGRRSFTLFIDDGLLKSMSNAWLKQLFKNDGVILDTFVSKHKQIRQDSLVLLDLPIRMKLSKQFKGTMV